MAPEFGFISVEQQKAFNDWISDPLNAKETSFSGDTHSGWDVAVFDVGGEPLVVKIENRGGKLPQSIFAGEAVSAKLKSAGIGLEKVEAE